MSTYEGPIFLVKVFWVRVTEARTSKKEKIWRRKKDVGKGLFTKQIVMMIHMKKKEEVVEVMREKLWLGKSNR